MTAKILDGKALAENIRQGLRDRILTLSQGRPRPPALAVLLVGDDPASSVYVRNKQRAAEKVGIRSQVIHLPAEASQEEILAKVDQLNEDSSIDAFIVQLPLPPHADAAPVIERVDPAKDADGLHPLSLGRLVCGVPGMKPCTPSGVMALLKHGGAELRGKHAVVVGRSNIVGKPVAHMLLQEHATVTICHSRTENLDEEVRRADIVVAAVGRPELIRGSWLREGACVIDVGMNRGADGKLVGDVAYNEAIEKASMITPVPRGVGPMTVAMLLCNTVAAYEAKATQF